MSRVLVTGVGGRGIGLQILKSLRLSELKLWIVGSDVSQRAVKGTPIDSFTELPRASSSDYLPALLRTIEANQIKFVFPGSEPEIRTLTETSTSQFEALDCTLVWQDPRVATQLDDKFSASLTMQQLKIASPKTVLAVDHDGVFGLQFPVLLKPRFGRASEGVEFARSRPELEALLLILNHRGIQSEYICQEYLPDNEGEFTAGVLHLPNGSFFGSSILRRDIRSTVGRRISVEKTPNSPEITISSGTSQGQFVEDSSIERVLQAAATALESRGPLNFQFRLQKGIPLIFEINPRFSGSSYLRALAGHNEVETLLRYHLGIPLPVWSSIDGRMAIREINEYVT